MSTSKIAIHPQHYFAVTLQKILSSQQPHSLENCSIMDKLLAFIAEKCIPLPEISRRAYLRHLLSMIGAPLTSSSDIIRYSIYRQITFVA